MLQENQKAPDFALPAHTGETVSLSQFLGQWVLVYFYPKDHTPGCTREACAIRDMWQELQKEGLVVLGVSADSIKSHQSFAQKHNLPFLLLSDPERKVIKAYGALKIKPDGKEGTKRISFLIDPEGKVAKVYKKVIPENHALEVLQDLKELKGKCPKS